MTEYFVELDQKDKCERVKDNKIQIPVAREDIISFFSEICRPAHERVQLDKKNIPLNAPDPSAPSVIRGFRSALVDLYRRQPKNPERLGEFIVELMINIMCE